MSTGQALRRLVPVIVIALVAAAAFAWTYTFAAVPALLSNSMQPASFPRLIAGAIILLSVIAAVNTVRRDERSNFDDIPREFYATIGVLVLSSAIAIWLDFLLAMMVGAAGIAFAWGERRALVLLGVGVVAPILTFLLFNEALQIRFPRGILLNIYYGW